LKGFLTLPLYSSDKKKDQENKNDKNDKNDKDGIKKINFLI
jgi:hypothetical protein